MLLIVGSVAMPWSEPRTLPRLLVIRLGRRRPVADISGAEGFIDPEMQVLREVVVAFAVIVEPGSDPSRVGAALPAFGPRAAERAIRGVHEEIALIERKTRRVKAVESAETVNRVEATEAVGSTRSSSTCHSSRARLRGRQDRRRSKGGRKPVSHAFSPECAVVNKTQTRTFGCTITQ
jgi:hypothetical protein